METKKYLNKKQAASMLGVCVITITKLVSNGELQAIKSCKKKWRFKEDDLKKYISIYVCISRCFFYYKHMFIICRIIVNKLT